MATALHVMYFHSVWMCDRFQGMAFMTRLSTTFLAVSFALAFGCRSVLPVAGGWFTAVTTVFGELIFQGLHSCDQ
jgi:hypothetical protein